MVEKVLHVGMCVKDIDQTIAVLRRTAGAEEIERVTMPERNQVSAYVKVGQNGDMFELMAPLGEGGTVADFLAKKGEGIHHISFFCDSVEETAKAFEEEGCRIIGRGKGVAFVHPKTSFGVLYELVDSTYE